MAVRLAHGDDGPMMAVGECGRDGRGLVAVGALYYDEAVAPGVTRWA